MRLIDVDALFEELNSKKIPWNRRINDIIMAQPTAYDVEKVAEQVNAYPHGYLNVEVAADLIEIIRKGGVNERD